MSSSSLIAWIENLLFGTTTFSVPPPELSTLILRMEVENIPWAHIMSEGGGLTSFPYLVHGDLNSLVDYLEKQWLDQAPPYALHALKTRAVTKFWHDLQLLLARRDEQPSLDLPVATDDDTLLQNMLEGRQPIPSPPHFQSAAFWGQVAYRFIRLRRPDGKASPLPPASREDLKRVMQLYDMTCRARGHFMHPWTFSLVPHSEYVNAVHWQSASHLEAFMHDRPTHPLTLSIETLVKRSVEEVLNGQRPSAYQTPCPRLEALLHNIRVIHQSVQQVPHENTPPKLIDIFQRLLALSYRDELWEKTVVAPSPTPPPLHGTHLFYLTEQLRLAEREKQVLWHHAIEREESVPEPRPRTCYTSLYANHKLGP